VKLLFDANISRRIVAMLEDLFPGSSQATLLGLSGEAPDEMIWEAARKGSFTIVTADTDFVRLSARYGAPPKVIRLERMDYSTHIAASLIRRNALTIAHFEKSKRNVLVLPRS
jgi:predicted nuclease of predicted toxin-antitoxin system